MESFDFVGRPVELDTEGQFFTGFYVGGQLG